MGLKIGDFPITQYLLALIATCCSLNTSLKGASTLGYNLADNVQPEYCNKVQLKLPFAQNIKSIFHHD